MDQRNLNARAPRPVTPPLRRGPWRLLAAALFVALTVTGSSLAESELLVIVHPTHPSAQVELGELRPLYKATKKNWSTGAKANPLNLPASNPDRISFDRAVLGMDPDEVSKYWIDRKIRGDGTPPRALPSPPAVVAAVAADADAVGYVPAGVAVDRVKVVARVRGGKVVPP